MHYYLLPESAQIVEIGSVVELDAKESKHLLRVMRTAEGDTVSLVDGKGNRVVGKLVRSESIAKIEITEIIADNEEIDKPTIHLVCGVIKNRRFELALEKAVEVGVAKITPMISDNCEINPRQGKQGRWKTLLETATKQSGRSLIPELAKPSTLDDFIKGAQGSTLFYGLARARVTVGEYFSPLDLDGEIAENLDELVWLVGPEGGWSEREIKLLSNEATAVRLGPHRLRTETAVIAGLSFLQACREKMKGKKK